MQRSRKHIHLVYLLCSEIPLTKKVILIEIMLVGTFAGIFATYSAIAAIASPNAFTLPCFINVTSASG